MKNLSRLIAILFIFISFNFAQLNAQLGLKAGVILSGLNFDDGPQDVVEINSETVIGYQFGAVYNLGIGDKWAIQPEVAFIRTGNKLVLAEGTAQENDRTTENNNLDLTAIVHYNLIGNNSGLRLYVLGGGFGEYQLSETTIFTLGSTIDRIKFDLSNEEFFNRLNYGVTYGLGLGFNSFFAQLRGSIGFSEFEPITITDSNGQAVGQTSGKTRYFTFLVGYLF